MTAPARFKASDVTRALKGAQAAGERVVLTAERLRQMLAYDPETGEFTWKVKAARNTMIGRRAGCVCSGGYRQIKIDEAIHREHRLAWLYVTGEWPKEQIDHINGERDNNRFANLREATQFQNNGNARRWRRKTSPKGVRFRDGRWHARIRHNGSEYHLGRFDTQEEAGDAYAAGARKLFGEFARPE